MSVINGKGYIEEKNGFPSIAWRKNVKNVRPTNISLGNSSSTRVPSLLKGSLSVHGVRLFNCLPQQLRDMTDVELPEFQKKLDEFLANIPNEPQSPGYTDMRRAASNSLLDMSQTSQWVRTCWMYYIFYNGAFQYNVGYCYSLKLSAVCTVSTEWTWPHIPKHFWG